MNKYFVPFIAVIVVYILPLVPKPALITDFRIVLLMVSCAVLFLTQPAFSTREAAAMKSTDKNSIYIILIAALGSQLVAVFEWAYFDHAQPAGVWSFVGLGIMAAGILFRLWAIRTLGNFFTATVQVQTNQKVITTGPYAIVRHPSYLGAYVAIVASAVALEAWYAVVVAALAMLYAYYKRISAEEEALVNGLGDEYRMYQSKTRAIIPLIW